ncbi:MAG: hypothetical protein KDI44_19365, partial [Thiothrix sp.]|nr:hypothetical protein [Thiothrix sp.]
MNGQAVGYIKQSFDRAWTPSTGYQANNLTSNTYYLLKDHLGSPQVLLDGNGNKLEDLSFSAWGSRQAASFDPNAPITPALDLLHDYALTMGFTGHEHDDVFGFINMKGRLYDPVLGRFLSADPFVQFANNTQSYNRYSYVLNNPLSFTDPSGYLLSGLKHFIQKNTDAIRTVVALATILIPGMQLTTLMAINGITAAVLTGVATGSLEAGLAAGFVSWATTGLSAGLTGAIAGGIPEAVGTISLARSIAHGVAQGAMSVLQGGKFKHGFVSGFFGHVGKNLGTALGFGELGTQQGKSARTFIAALVGGTVSERTGGKFANGAMTAAIVHLYNA